VQDSGKCSATGGGKKVRKGNSVKERLVPKNSHGMVIYPEENPRGSREEAGSRGEILERGDKEAICVGKSVP